MLALALWSGPRTGAQATPLVGDPIVFVSRQIPDRGTIYWNVPRDQPGVGAYSRFRVASPGHLLVRNPDGLVRVLIDGVNPTPASLALIDVNAPDVSYDGQWIAFAGLPQGSYDPGPLTNPGAWRIYVMRADGSGLRRVTASEDRSGLPADLVPYDDTDPCWLPDGRLVFSSTRWPSYAQYGGVRTTNLYVINSDGTGLQRITSERNAADRPLVDPLTGKIVYARWWRNHRFPVNELGVLADAAGGWRRAVGLSADRAVQMDGSSRYFDWLWRNAWQAATINPDGTGLAMWGGSFRDEEANHVYGGVFTPAGEFLANYFPMFNMAEASGFGGIRKYTRGSGRYTPLMGITTLTRDYVNPTNPTSFGVFRGTYVTEPAVLLDGRLVVSVATDVNQDYALYVANADGSGLTPLYGRVATTELRARVVHARPLPPILADTIRQVPSLRPPSATGPYDVDGTFVFDALNVYFNAPVDTDIVSAPAIGSAATMRFFIDHQRTSPGSFPNLDWPILLKELPIAADGSVRDAAAPANVPLFEQIRSPNAEVPFTGGPYPDGAAHVAGMNFGRPGGQARCVGCHGGHTMIPVPVSADAAKWTNLAPGARIEVSSTRDASYDRGLIDRRVMKGETWRYWTSANGQYTDQWATLVFPVPIRVHKVRLYNPRNGGEANSSLVVHDATVRLFSDEAATQQVAVQSAGALMVSGTDVVFAPTVARAVRVNIGAVTGTFYGMRVASLAEIEVVASGDVSSNAPPPTNDGDGDGQPDDWEARFGLNPSDPGDASADPDGDGISTRDEYVRGTHPRAFHTRYFAEGASSAFFQTQFALLNPGTQAAHVLLRFLKSNGTRAAHALTLPPRRRMTLDAGTIGDLGAADFSTIVESDQLVVVDRTMSWSEQGYGSHAEGSLASPSLTWYLAEGATHGNFDLFYLLQNPNDTAAEVRVRYLLPSGAPIEKTYTVGPLSRRTIWVDDEQFPAESGNRALAATDVSAVLEVTAGQPIIVERAMYLTRDGQPFTAGHESAGITQPSTRWFLAEGATGSFFDLYILVANPSDRDADVQFTYLLPDGTMLTKSYAVRAGSRLTISVDQEEFPANSGARLLENAAVSTIVESSNAVPIIVERAMWWPATPAGAWTEAHNSPGATSTGTRWALAAGELGGPKDIQTYVLVANTSPLAGTARVTVIYEDGTSAEQIIALPPSSRTNVDIRTLFAGAAGRRFGVIIESLDETPRHLVVERAMYANAGGVVWAAGTNALGTILPDPD